MHSWNNFWKVMHSQWLCETWGYLGCPLNIPSRSHNSTDCQHTTYNISCHFFYICPWHTAHVYDFVQNNSLLWSKIFQSGPVMEENLRLPSNRGAPSICKKFTSWQLPTATNLLLSKTTTTHSICCSSSGNNPCWCRWFNQANWTASYQMMPYR